jgi:hypothetical protein
MLSAFCSPTCPFIFAMMFEYLLGTVAIRMLDDHRTRFLLVAIARVLCGDDEPEGSPGMWRSLDPSIAYPNPDSVVHVVRFKYVEAIPTSLLNEIMHGDVDTLDEESKHVRDVLWKAKRSWPVRLHKSPFPEEVDGSPIRGKKRALDA